MVDAAASDASAPGAGSDTDAHTPDALRPAGHDAHAPEAPTQAGFDGPAPDAPTPAGFDAHAPDAPALPGSDARAPDAPASCGYHDQGQRVPIGPDVEICLPPVACTPSETCPRGLGDCVDGRCVPRAGYRGLATVPEAWATYYCELSTGGCDGSVINPRPYEIAKAMSAKLGPVCADAPNTTETCVGIAATPPLMAGNSQIAIDPSTGQPVKLWGLGMTAASGACYRVIGPAGSAIVAIADRCAGYCQCGKSGGAVGECSACINSDDTTVACSCIGPAPPLYSASCASTPTCDWCASNNHPHFDLDNATFRHVCGPDGLMAGRCRLTTVTLVEDCYPPRPNWPL